MKFLPKHKKYQTVVVIDSYIKEGDTPLTEKQHKVLMVAMHRTPDLLVNGFCIRYYDDAAKFISKWEASRMIDSIYNKIPVLLKCMHDEVVREINSPLYRHVQ